MPIKIPDGIPREDIGRSIYDFERSGTVRTGDITQQQEAAYYMQQERNLRICLIAAVLFGLGFLYSLYGAWKG